MTGTGILTGICISLIGCLLVITPVGTIVKENSHNLVEKAEGLGFASRGRFLMVAAFITLLHSAMEEYYWRWFIYGHLRQMVGHWPGHLIAAVAFYIGGLHINRSRDSRLSQVKDT